MRKTLRRTLSPCARILLCMVLQLTATSLLAQNVNLTGKVTEQNSPDGLPGVNIIEKGTTNGVVTDADGSYKISVASGATLVFSFIGYAEQEVIVTNQTTIDLAMVPDIATLQEVVVIGYGTVAKRDLTGSVASVSGKNISATPVANIGQAMQGKMAGVNVVSQDGRPGADVAIRVRGGTSISQSNQPLVVIDGFPGGSLLDVPPDQVESIDVLKDASATAIYGARGANGVILVTTKRAKAGKTTVSYSGYVKFNTPTKYLKSLKPYDYLEYVWANAAANGTAYREPFEKLYGIGAYEAENPGGIENYRDMASDDIQKKVYNESVTWNHDLTLTAGTENTKVLLSASYLNDQGMKLNSYFKRANIYLKLNQKVARNVTFDLNARYINTEDFGNEGTTNGSGSLLSTSYKFRPIATEHILGDLAALEEGNIEQYGKNSMWDTFSPVARIKDYYPLETEQTIRTIASINWKITSGLNYDVYVTLNKGWKERQYWTGAIFNNYIDPDGEKTYAGNADYRRSDNWGTRITNTLSYDFKINDVNKLNIMAGHEVSNTGGNSMNILATRFPSNFTREEAFGQINQYDEKNGTSTISSQVEIPNRLISFFSRANYSFKDRLLFTFTFRADGSSKFAPSNRWAYFPAAAVAYRLSDESFLKGVSWLDELKLRVSYGEVGNDGISANLWSQSWKSVTDPRMEYAMDQTSAPAYDLNSATFPNPNLKWETTTTRNIGTDFSVFGGRLSGTIDAYWNTTEDLLMYTPYMPITGYPFYYANVGQTSNKGIELSLSGVVLESGDWKISAGGNINFNKNNVDKLDDNITGLYKAAWAGSASYPTNDYILKEDHPVGLVRGYQYDGYYTPDDFDYNNGVYTLKSGVPDLSSVSVGTVHGITTANRPAGQYAYPGLPKYKNLNGDNVINESDVEVIGNMVPKHTGGFNLNVTYKSFDLGMFFNWSYGNEIYNANKLASLYGPKEAGVYENKLDIHRNAYKIYQIVDGQLVRLNTPEELNAANANATLPLSYNELGITSTLGIEDGSFLRLNTLSLGYTLPEALISKAGMSSFRVYGSIYNVFTITGYSGLDPEVNTSELHNNASYPTTGLDFGTYPRARSFVLGVNLTF